MSIFHRNFQSMVKLYNWFCNYYGTTEKYTTEIAKNVLKELTETKHMNKSSTILEYACGTGSLTFVLGEYFKSVIGKDSSTGMLKKANEKNSLNNNIKFEEGDIKNINEANNSYDWVFVSFAIHLFPPGEVEKIIKKMLTVAKIGIVIIDHSKIWKLSTAIVELLEGSYYNDYIHINFQEIAEKNNVKIYNEKNYNNYYYCVMIK